MIDATANTPDKADLLRFYSGVWDGLPKLTTSNLLLSLDRSMKRIENSHGVLVEELQIVDSELVKSFGGGSVTSTEVWVDGVNEKASVCYQL